MTEQELKERMGDLKFSIRAYRHGKCFNPEHFNDVRYCHEDDCLDCLLLTLNDIGVVIADKDAELPDYSDEAPWLRDHSRLVAKEMRSLGYTKTHSLMVKENEEK